MHSIREENMSSAFRLVVFGFLLLSLFAAPVAAQAPGRTTLPAPRVAASADGPLWHLGGSTEAVAVQGDYAYLAQGLHLHVINLNTRLVEGTLSFRYPLRDVAVSGDYAYVVTGIYGDLHVVDVHDPTQPTKVGLGSLTVGGEGVAVRWPYVYVVCRWSSEMLVVFDVTTPSAPIEKIKLGLSKYGRWAKLGDEHLYVVSLSGDLGIIDISNPLDPQEKDWLSLGAENLAVVEPYVYVTGSVGFRPGVHIVNVGDPDAPTVVGTWDYPYTGSTLGVAAMGDYLYVGYNSNSFSPSDAIHILDMSDRGNPIRVAVYATYGGLYNLLLQGQTLYVAGGPDGDFRSLDLSVPTDPVSGIYLNWPGYVEQVRTVGSRAYLSARSDYYGVRDGIWIYDMTDPLLPVLLDYEDPMGSIYDFMVEEPYLYMSGYMYLRIRDTDDLWTPLGFYSHDQGVCNSVAVEGTMAYVLVLFKDLYVLNVADPASPTYEDSLPIASDGLVQIVTDGDRAYVVKQSEKFFVLDISNPLAPAIAAEYSLPGLQTLLPQGNHLFAGTMAYSGTLNGLTVLDVSDLGNIHPVGSFETLNSVQGLDASDGVVYLSGHYFAHALDVTDVQNPTPLWSYSGPAEGASIAALGVHALVADEDLGLTLHAVADGIVRPEGEDSAAVFPQEALVVTFARDMNPSSVTYSCTPDPGGWQGTWTGVAMEGNPAAEARVLTLEHSPFAKGQTHTFSVTSGETAEGNPITPFGLTFTVADVQQVHLPLVLRRH
ncbi:LVIVD repeat-containing protein [Chloroflexota bacterium]